jgi:hypothetical protein
VVLRHRYSFTFFFLIRGLPNGSDNSSSISVCDDLVSCVCEAPGKVEISKQEVKVLSTTSTHIDRSWHVIAASGTRCRVGEGTCIDCWGGMAARGCRVWWLHFVYTAFVLCWTSVSGRLLIVLSSSFRQCCRYYFSYNKLENIRRTFANLCHSRFIHPNFHRSYDSILNYSNFKTLYCRRRHLDTSFLLNIFKEKSTVIPL